MWPCLDESEDLTEWKGLWEEPHQPPWSDVERPLVTRVRNHREVNAGAEFTFSFWFNPRSQPRASRQAFSQFTLLRNILWSEPRGISMVIMNPIKSIVRINYHNGICCSLKGDVILSLKIILCMLLSLIGYSCIGLFWSKSSLKKYLHIVFSHFYCIETRTVSPLEAPESMRQSVFLSQIASLYILCPSLCPG